MLQAIVKKGKVFGEDIPSPSVSKGALLIKVSYSCISAGTELKSVKNSGDNLIKRALNQPQNLKKVIDFAKTQGIQKALTKVKSKVTYGNPTGYSLAGVVEALGEGVQGFKIGDKVAAAGAGIANHAEYVDVPQNLVMKVPSGLDLNLASTVTLGGISMQGVRRADLKLGEFCVITGAGILGLLSLQMLSASGVRTIVIDIKDDRLKIAKELGADLIINPINEDAVKEVTNYTGGFGADAVIFTAATGDSGALSQSFQMCKKKGKVVLVGISGMEIKREDIYTKELDFQMSTSYGPGRYDPNYEEKGLDYPYSYVRWTENRNMTEYLRLLENESIKIDALINKTYPIEEVTEAFESLQSPERPLMVLLSYSNESKNGNSDKVVVNTNINRDGKIKVALIGAGSFATGMHLPNMQKLKDKYSLQAVANRSGFKAKSVASQFGASYATSNIEEVLNDKEVDLVMITTRHDSHAELVYKSLKAGKNVFVEKPLATNQEELDKIKDFYNSDIKNKPVLFTGYNRRFSKYLQKIKTYTDQRINPLTIHYRMNAGFIPMDHWVHDDGGRIVGEGCHIIDLMTFLTGSKIKSISYEKLTPSNEKISQSDNVSMILNYSDGTICSIQYFATGSKSFAKEYMEVHFDEKTIVMEDYKTLKGYGINISEIDEKNSEKGQYEELISLYETLSGKNNKWPIELWDMVQTTEATFAISGN